jgi:hypothetical protein
MRCTCLGGVEAVRKANLCGKSLCGGCAGPRQVLIAFVFLGKYLEALAMGRTSAALAKLMNLQARTRPLNH